MNIAMIGVGGHSKVVRDVILSDSTNQIIGYFDDQFENMMIKEKVYYGPVSLAKKMIHYFSEITFMIGIGNNQTRKRLAQRLDLPDESFMTWIHPSAVVSPSAQIGKGSVVMAHAVINADTRIGTHTIINTSAIVEHDNRLGDFIHVSPNATLTGSVKLGEGSHIGAGATVTPNVTIGEWSIVGAGATVIHDLPSHCTAVGVPAKVKVTGGV